jgi:hypothetical protein
MKEILKMYDMLTKNKYHIVKYQKGLILYTDPVKIDISLIDLMQLDDDAYMKEVERVYGLDDFEKDILKKLRSLENGGGAVWSKGIMLINPDDQVIIDELKKFSFHEMIEIDTSCWDSKFLKVVDDTNNDIKSLTLKEISILFRYRK